MVASLRPTRAALLALAHTLAISVVAIAMTYGIGAAAQASLLIPLAAPLGLALVAGMAWLPGKPQLIGWAVLTVWLLSTTYLGHGDLEPVALVVVVVLSLLGVFKSPWFLVAVWTLHPVWDLAVPRVLPALQQDLPLGCLIYDLVVAAYLACRTIRGRLHAVGGTQPVGWPLALRRLAFAVVVGLLVLVQVFGASYAADQGLLVALAAPIALVVAAGLWFLPAAEQRVAWVVLTGWMGMTYAHFGQWHEIVFFLVIVVLAILGATTTTWYFPIAWGAHLLWNLLPRTHHHGTVTMGHLGLDPLASAIYDAVILVVLIVAVRMGRLEPRPPTTELGSGLLPPGDARTAAAPADAS